MDTAELLHRQARQPAFLIKISKIKAERRIVQRAEPPHELLQLFQGTTLLNECSRVAQHHFISGLKVGVALQIDCGNPVVRVQFQGLGEAPLRRREPPVPLQLHRPSVQQHGIPFLEQSDLTRAHGFKMQSFPDRLNQRRFFRQPGTPERFDLRRLVVPYFFILVEDGRGQWRRINRTGWQPFQFEDGTGGLLVEKFKKITGARMQIKNPVGSRQPVNQPQHVVG